MSKGTLNPTTAAAVSRVLRKYPDVRKELESGGIKVTTINGEVTVIRDAGRGTAPVGVAAHRLRDNGYHVRAFMFEGGVPAAVVKGRVEGSTPPAIG